MANKIDPDERVLNNTRTQESIQCPFWMGETRKAVICEGLCAGERIRRIFQEQDEKKKLQDYFCSNHYQQCQIFQLVYRGYMQ